MMNAEYRIMKSKPKQTPKSSQPAKRLNLTKSEGQVTQPVSRRRTSQLNDVRIHDSNRDVTQPESRRRTSQLSQLFQLTE